MSAPARARSPVTAALREIQAPVRARLAAVTEELRRIVSAELPLIAEVGEHLLAMRGKMFRPTLTLLASEVEGTPEPRAVTLAAVVELIHLATLVHDDAVDHSVLRRGMPTVNSVFSHEVSVIMGDFLYARALAVLVRDGDLETLRIISAASNAMTVGEMRQLAALDALSFDEDDYYALIGAKTAALMSAACEVGALCGAARHRAALARFGAQLGLAFQIADDLLDYTEASATTGKPSGLDLREHKVTLPLIAALRQMPAAARARVEALFATPEPDDALIAEVVGIAQQYGGIEYARRQGERFAREAEGALSALPASRAADALLDAVSYVMDRRR